MYAQALGYAAVGIGGRLVFHTVQPCFNRICCLEMDQQRYGISLHRLSKLITNNVLSVEPPCILKQVYSTYRGGYGFLTCDVDVHTQGNAKDLTEFSGLGDRNDIVIYCWERCIGHDVFKHLADLAYNTPAVKGIIYVYIYSERYFYPVCVTSVCVSHTGLVCVDDPPGGSWKKVAKLMKCKAGSVSFCVSFFTKRPLPRAAAGVARALTHTSATTAARTSEAPPKVALVASLRKSRQVIQNLTGSGMSLSTRW